MGPFSWRKLYADNLIEGAAVASGELSAALQAVLQSAAPPAREPPGRPRPASVPARTPRAMSGPSPAPVQLRRAAGTDGPLAGRRPIDWRKLRAEHAARIERSGVAPGELLSALQTLIQPAAPPVQQPPDQPDTASVRGEDTVSDERTFADDLRRALLERPGVAPGELATALQTLLRPAPSPVRRRPGRPCRAPVPGEKAAGNERSFTVAGHVGDALVHLPAGAERGTAVPLVCMLHGCTQDPPTFAAATRMNKAADRYGFVAVYPRQSRGENNLSCWNWFLREHQVRGRGEPASIAGIVSELIGTTTEVTIDTRRVFVAGLSAGGAMAAILAATYPDLFAAVAVHSGLAYGCASSLSAAFRAMARGSKDPDGHGRAAYASMGIFARPIPTIVIHGSNDRRVAPVNARDVLQQSMTANRLAAPERCDLDIARPSTTRPDQVNGGHAYTRSQWTDRHGALLHELLMVDGLGHAWSGGAPGGSHTDPLGPDATDAIWRFFSQATSHERAG